jgi:hypothetical protein
LSRKQRLQDTGRRALRALQSFAGTFKVSFHDLELGVDAASGTADSGVLEADLPEVLLLVAEAAKDGDAAVAITIDEMQYLTAEALAALIVAAHKVAQKQLPLLLFGAGLPQLAALAGDAKSYAERLFDFPPVEALTPAEARDALREPARREGVDYDNEALALIVEQTRGYPYFLQEWGSSAWNVAPGSPITAADANRATELAVAQLDSGFFRVRFDRLTPREKDYMRAMAGLGPGPHRSGDIAQALNQGVASVAPLRQALITKGMIYSPAHGDTAFTVPMFDEFLRRTVPDWRPRAAAPNPAS